MREPTPRTASPNVATCDKDAPPKIPITIRISMFFDGTGNNRTNITLQSRWEDGGRRGEAPGEPGSSYTAGYSNVVHLDAKVDDAQPGYDKSDKVYVEGIGTVNAGDDSDIGYGTGQGSTGIIDRVTKGIDEAVARIGDAVDEKGARSLVIVTKLDFDSLGFSRGAAAARHFVHRAIRQGEMARKVRAAGITLSATPKARYVGVFDTVPSHGLDVGNERINDVADLGLNAVAVAEKTVHLCAADEHRKNFSLVNIKSAGGKGREIYMPGAHSDVGGSYNTTEDELNWQVYDIDTVINFSAHNRALAEERAWLIEQGWYLDDEVRPANRTNEIICHRSGIKNDYARIPLQMMGRYAGETQLMFSALPDDLPVPPELRRIAQGVESAAATSPDRWFGLGRNRAASGEVQWLRHTYLHFSARYGERWRAHVPRWTNNDPVGGMRERKIHDG